MKVDYGAVLELAHAGQQPQLHIQPACGAKARGRGECHAALQRMMIDASKIHGGALASIRALHGFSARLNTTNTQLCPSWKKFDLVLWRNVAADERAGHHATEALDRKSAINRQAKIAQGILSRNFAGLLYERLRKFRQALSRLRTDWNDRGIFQKGSAKKVIQFHSNQFEGFAIHQVGLS